MLQPQRIPPTEVLQVSSLASEIRLEDSVGSIGG